MSIMRSGPDGVQRPRRGLPTFGGHLSPVRFQYGNPIVGDCKLKDCIRLLFWIEQSFDEPGLTREGSIKSAGVRIAMASEIDLRALRPWLNLAVEDSVGFQEHHQSARARSSSEGAMSLTRTREGAGG